MYGGVPSVVLYGVVAQPIPYGQEGKQLCGFILVFFDFN